METMLCGVFDRVREFVSTGQAWLLRGSTIKRALRKCPEVKVYYGCGGTRQPGYLNVDLRWTPAVDVLGDLEWCSRHLAAACDEVYLSHVLEHYNSPGKAMRDGPDTVLGALMAIHRMLKPGGIVRIAVPDFEAVVRIYLGQKCPLYPRLLGRICGEQDYRQNKHSCAFDRTFLEECLLRAGFHGIASWDPRSTGLVRDGSFDEIEGVKTSLNIMAVKSG